MLTDAQVADIAGMTAGTSLGARARDLAREVRSSRSTDDQHLLELLEAASTITCVRATPRARELADKPGCDPALGHDSITISLKVAPADADLLLRFLGGRTHRYPGGPQRLDAAVADLERALGDAV